MVGGGGCTGNCSGTRDYKFNMFCGADVSCTYRRVLFVTGNSFPVKIKLVY